MTDGRESGARRIPQQKRSRERWQSLVVSAGELFSEQGFDRVTTNAIAARAGVPIGTLYQFFPDKEAILEALVAQYSQEVERLFDDPGGPFGEFVDLLVERIAAYDEDHVAFRAMLSSSGQAPAMQQTLHGQTVRVLSARFPGVTAERIAVVATVALGLVRGLMPLAGQGLSPSTARAESQRALKAYLAQALEPF